MESTCLFRMAVSPLSIPDAGLLLYRSRTPIAPVFSLSEKWEIPETATEPIDIYSLSDAVGFGLQLSRCPVSS